MSDLRRLDVEAAAKNRAKAVRERRRFAARLADPEARQLWSEILDAHDVLIGDGLLPVEGGEA